MKQSFRVGHYRLEAETQEEAIAMGVFASKFGARADVAEQSETVKATRNAWKGKHRQLCVTCNKSYKNLALHMYKSTKHGGTGTPALQKSTEFPF